MKKALAGSFLAIAFLLPSVSFAQTTPVSNEDLQVQIASLQAQIVSLLTQLIAQLQSQLEAQNADIQTIKTNTTPVPAAATGGEVSATPAVVALELYQVSYEPKDEDGNFGDLYIASNKQLNTSSLVLKKGDATVASSFTVSFQKSLGGSNCWTSQHCDAYVYRLASSNIPATNYFYDEYTVSVSSQDGDTASARVRQN